MEVGLPAFGPTHRRRVDSSSYSVLQRYWPSRVRRAHSKHLSNESVDRCTLITRQSSNFETYCRRRGPSTAMYIFLLCCQSES
jgi:hypothetical protein